MDFLNIGMLPHGNGMLPHGNFVGGDMAEVISENTSQLTDADRQAIAIYLMMLPNVDDQQ